MDRTKVLHGPLTKTYGETNYLKKSSFGQNQGITWSSDSNLWGNQLLKEIISFGQNQGIAWSSDSNLWGNQLLKENLSFGQNQGIAWYSDSNLWENQLLMNQVLDRTKVLHGPRTQTYGETNY